MIELKDIRNIYFIGIGGIGMSALARYFHSLDVKVSGYDKTPTVLAKTLEAEGILVHYTDDLTQLDKNANAVVYTPAVPADHAELNWYRNNGYEVMKRSDILQVITNESFNICIAGTHGKTSISTLTGHILRHTGYGCNAFLGGISVNYETNFWSQGAEASAARNVCVVEADEYDRSFLKLDPDIAVVTAMDADHLDIYGTVEKMEEAFIEFAGRIKSNGLLIRKHALTKLNAAAVRRQLTYQLENDVHNADDCDDETHDHDADAPDIYAEDIRMEEGGYLFNASISGVAIENVRLNIGGLHNIENALAAITVAKVLNIDTDKIKDAVAAFRGVKRRFEYVIKDLKGSGKGLVFIDDYAHHPEELQALIGSAKKLFPGMKCTVIFQPHLFTRTRDLAAGFSEALNKADEVLLLPIYPARELPIPGVNSGMIADGIKDAVVKLATREECIAAIEGDQVELLIAAGAGDIDTLVPVLAKSLMDRYHPS